MASFESGSLTFRMFYVPEGMPADVVDRFAAHAAPPIDLLGKEEINGWVTSRHLLDRAINEDSVMIAGYLRLTLMKAERKIPPALLRAECQMAELAEREARGVDILRRDVRAEIKKAIVDRLLPTMPPTLTGIPMVYDARRRIVYAGVASDRQMEAFSIAFARAAGKSAVPLVPATAALMRRKVNARDLSSTSFSPECGDDEASDSLGQDFLTWLWFFAEARGGVIALDGGECAVLIEGPLTFVREGEGAHETILRKGSPLSSSEARTALLGGKKLRRARVTLAQGEQIWTATLDADEFVIRGLKLPKGDAVDPIGRFEGRMLMLDRFQESWMAFFDRFLDERATPSVWERTRADIHRWVSERQGRI